jgi:hypothetical protein
MPTPLTSLTDLDRIPVGPILDLDPAGHPRNPLLAFDGDSCQDASEETLADVARHVRHCRAITIAIGRRAPVPAQVAEAVDLVLAPNPLDRHTVAVEDPLAELDALEQMVTASPRAALALTWLLRDARPDVPEALVAESATYSMLLAGPDFASWLRRRGPARPDDGGERVRMTRVGDQLDVVLARPARRNAVDTAMRTALLEALTIAGYDRALRVRISALGPDFSAGGDLDEFGSAPDPAAAHLVRVVASVGGLLHELRDRVTVRVHGACIGAGVELPCFAGRITAAEGTTFRLPEVGMGLVPGAGGTVSIPRRIGRWRTLWLALRGVPIDVDTGLSWGLVDALD